MRKAYSYQRFSTGKQQDGDSLKRQSNAAQTFCKQHGLQLVNTFRDEGVSGFKGKNFSNESALGHFLKLVEDGTVEKGSVLVLESMDRLSRQSILPCIGKFTDIVHAGVSIGVLSLNKVLDEESLAANPMDLMLVMVEFMRANNESAMKSTRTKSAIQSKVERAKAGERVYFGAQAPTWLKGVNNGKWITDDAKVKIVQRVFAMYLAGDLCNAIARKLNADKIPSLRTGSSWLQGNVKSILTNSNATGYCSVTGFEKDDYYPQIVSPSDFQKVQTKLSFNSTTRGGSKKENVPNVFRGLLFCTCGGPIDVKTYYYGEKKYFYAFCRNSINGNGCNIKQRVPIQHIELAMFSAYRHQEDVKVKASKNVELVALEDKLATAEMSINRLTDVLLDPELKDLAGLKTKLKEATMARETCKNQIAELKAKDAQLAEMPKAMSTLLKLMADGASIAQKREWLKNFQSFIAVGENRKKVRNLMPDILKRVVVSHDKQGEYKVVKLESTMLDEREHVIKCIYKEDGKLDVEIVK